MSENVFFPQALGIKDRAKTVPSSPFVPFLIVVETGRNSIGVEIDPVYLKMARRKLAGCCSVRRMFGPLESQLLVDYSSQAQLRRVSDPSLSGQQPAAVLV